jgi:hypothetical protein
MKFTYGDTAQLSHSFSGQHFAGDKIINTEVG